MTALREGLLVHWADTRRRTLELLGEIQPHLVYLYCHGGIYDGEPYLQVGPPEGGPITADNLRGLINWSGPRPLVFINGCRTTALDPELAMDFVTAFVENAGAAGVMGTEITVFESLATAFAERCLRLFLADGVPLGEAVRRVRLSLLTDGNPHGLVYIPFAVAGLRLLPETAGG